MLPDGLGDVEFVTVVVGVRVVDGVIVDVTVAVGVIVGEGKGVLR